MNPFDPIVTVKGYVDHTKTQELNTVLVGVPLLENNTIGYTTQITEYFPSGTGIQWAINGLRQTSNSPLNIVDPQYSAVLAGSGHPAPAGWFWFRHEREIYSHRKEEPPDH